MGLRWFRSSYNFFDKNHEFYWNDWLISPSPLLDETHVVYSRTNSTFFTGFGFEPLSPEGDAGYPEVWAWNGSSVSGVELSMFNSTQTFSSSGSTFAWLLDYRAVCWGTNDMGQLGQGNKNTINTMVNVTLSSLKSRLILLLENTIHVL